MCFCQAEIDWISTEPPLSKLMMHILTPTVAPWPSWEIDAVIMCFMRFLIKSFTASLAHHNILRALKGPRHDLRSDVPFIRSEMIFSKSLIEGQLDPFDRCSFDLSCWDNCDLLGDAQAKLLQKAHFASCGVPRSQAKSLHRCFHRFFGCMVNG